MLEVRRSSNCTQYIVSNEGVILLVTSNYNLAMEVEEDIKKNHIPKEQRLEV